MSRKKGKMIAIRVSEDMFYNLKYLCDICNISITKFFENCIDDGMNKWVFVNYDERHKLMEFKKKFKNQ